MPLVHPDIADVVAVMATHNRRPLTMRAITSLEQSADSVAERVGVVMVDDASSDGTPEAVSSAWPQVEIIQGNGMLFWGGATRRGLQAVQRISPKASVLLLNDDTMLARNALKNLVDHFRSDSVAVGGCGSSPTSLVYGPLLRDRYPFGYRVPTTLRVGRELDAFQANAVLVPRCGLDTVGVVDEVFVHNLGDIDYSLRLRKEGFTLRYAGFVGHAEPNPLGDGRPAPGEPLVSRIRTSFGVKGSPLRASLILFRRHAGRFWPLFWMRYVVARFVRAVLAGRRY